MSDFDINILKEKTEKSLNVLREELGTVRAGRANAALVDKVTVDYYGSPTPLKALSNISVPDPRTLMISPFDPPADPAGNGREKKGTHQGRKEDGRGY